MLSLDSALRVASHLATIGAHLACAEASRLLPGDISDPDRIRASRMRRAVIDRLTPPAATALAALTALLDDAGIAPVAPPGPGDTPSRHRDDVVAAVCAQIAGDALTSAAFDLALGASDVHVAARAADHVSSLLPAAGATAHLRVILASTLVILDDARARVDAAAPRFLALIPDPIWTAARAAATALTALISARPSFDGADAHHTWRAGDRWAARVAQALFELIDTFPLACELTPPTPAGADDHAALAAALAHPDDDAPRATLADLATKRGDPRGDLLLAQLRTALAQRRRGFARGSDLGLAAALIERHPEWSADLVRLGAAGVVFRRGLIEEIAIDAPTLLANADTLFRTAPLRALRLRSITTHLPAILASPWLAQIRSLTLSGEALTDADIQQLAGAGTLTGLRALDLRDNRITNAGVRALYASPTLTSLALCELDGNPCSDLFTSEWTLHEIPTREWLSTDLGRSLEQELGQRRWASPWQDPWPPEYDVLMAPAP